MEHSIVREKGGDRFCFLGSKFRSGSAMKDKARVEKDMNSSNCTAFMQREFFSP